MTNLHSREMKRGLYRKAAPMMALMVRKNMEAGYTSVGLHCVQADHQSNQTERLARLAYLLGMGAEIAQAIPVAGDNRPGLHQALATGHGGGRAPLGFQLGRLAVAGCRYQH